MTFGWCLFCFCVDLNLLFACYLFMSVCDIGLRGGWVAGLVRQLLLAYDGYVGCWYFV